MNQRVLLLCAHLSPTFCCPNGTGRHNTMNHNVGTASADDGDADKPFRTCDRWLIGVTVEATGANEWALSRPSGFDRLRRGTK
jgi:hypothetical protein